MISFWLLSCWTASTRLDSLTAIAAARPVTVVTMLSRVGFVNRVHYAHRQVNSLDSIRAATPVESVVPGSRLNSTTAHRNASVDSGSAAKVNVIGGHVYFVATPIGNLDDITLRAINVLTNADVVCVEDSRHSVHLLRHLGIQHKTMVSHHEHNLQSSIPRILDLARSGKSIAVVSDAGTPGISDPGAQLADALGRAKVMMMMRCSCACALLVTTTPPHSDSTPSIHLLGPPSLKIPLHPIPGPSALVAALSVAGFAASPCTFLGFLPVKGTARTELLDLMATTTHTMVFYESPHRIRKTIQDLLHHRRDAEGRLGEVGPGMRSRSIVVCRELTKLYEELIRGSLVEVAEALSISTVTVTEEESVVTEEQSPESSLLVRMNRLHCRSMTVLMYR